MHPSLILGEITPEQQEHKLRLMQVLKRYLPANAFEYCSELIILHRLHLHIEVERKDRLGDYHPHWGKGNRISINHNLEPYDFLITFIHELAHHTTHRKFGNQHQPHGREWKSEFRVNMEPFIQRHIFPADLEAAIIAHMRNPAYTHTGDVKLMKVLARYGQQEAGTFLADLPAGALFKMSKRGRVVMRKGEKRRTYYRCESVPPGKAYLVHEAASVVPVTG